MRIPLPCMSTGCCDRSIRDVEPSGDDYRGGGGPVPSDVPTGGGARESTPFPAFGLPSPPDRRSRGDRRRPIRRRGGSQPGHRCLLPPGSLEPSTVPRLDRALRPVGLIHLHRHRPTRLHRHVDVRLPPPVPVAHPGRLPDLRLPGWRTGGGVDRLAVRRLGRHGRDGTLHHPSARLGGRCPPGMESGLHLPHGRLRRGVVGGPHDLEPPLLPRRPVVARRGDGGRSQRRAAPGTRQCRGRRRGHPARRPIGAGRYP